MPSRDIALDRALRIIFHVPSLAEKFQVGPLAIIVLDVGGRLKAGLTQDGAGAARAEMFANCINKGTQGAFMPLPGGVLITENTQIIGAIGIAGAFSDLDETTTKKALVMRLNGLAKHGGLKYYLRGMKKGGDIATLF